MPLYSISKKRPHHPSQEALRALMLVAGLSLAACGSADPPDPPLPTTTSSWGADPTTVRFVFEGDRFAFLAAETHSGNYDANGDDDGGIDTFPVVVDTLTGTETALLVAAQDIAFVGDHLYLDVDESLDERDWDGSTVADGRVLLHWTEGMGDPEFVTSLDSDAETALLSTGDLAIIDTGLNSVAVIDAADPTQPVWVDDSDGFTFDVELLDLQEGVLFFAYDELSAGLDLNSDTDQLDTRVLGLLDATAAPSSGVYPNLLCSTGFAIPTGDTPLLSREISSGLWTVAFLVDEASQDDGSGEGLNNLTEVGQTFSPCHFLGDEDLDAVDEVLHFVEFDGDLDDGVSNAGLVGSERIIYAGGYIGTVSVEGVEGACDLNGDGDLTDRVFRWVKADPFNLEFENDEENHHALAELGPSVDEVATMGDRFVIVVNEMNDNTDHDGFGIEERDLVAWLAPGSAWVFHHDNDDDYGWVVATWIGDTSSAARVGVAFSEHSREVDLNVDGDVNDSVPTFAHYDGSTGFMEFPGYGIGIDPDNAGIEILGDWGFYRVSELAEGADLDGNGGSADKLLWASNLITGETPRLGALNSYPGAAVFSNDARATCAAFLIDEGGFVGDVNGDSDETGNAVRWFCY